MFCRMCGHKLADNAKFCPGCGARIAAADGGTTSEGTFDDAQEKSDAAFWQEKNESSSRQEDDFAGDWQEEDSWESAQAATGSDGTSERSGEFEAKKFFTAENIERFAPMASLFCLGMWAVYKIIVGFLWLLLGVLPFGYIIMRIFTGVICTAFVGITAAAAIGLIYIAVKKKDPAKQETWMAPAAVLLSFLSCLGIGCGWGFIAFIFGAAAVVLGAELLARVVIAGEPMDSKVNYQKAFDLYKQFIAGAKEKKEEEESGGTTPALTKIQSEFTGSGVTLFGYTILTALVCFITCGIAAPWMICKILKWRIEHTVINGKKLTFTGTGGSLLGHWILWELLTILTCGMFGIWVHIALRKWELQRTFIDGEPVVMSSDKKERVSNFDGKVLSYLGYSVLSALILIVTLGLAYPWVMAMLQGWDTKHQIINRHRLTFDGTGLGFLGEFLIIWILTIITCGIYSSWGTVRMNRYIIRHTNFVD